MTDQAERTVSRKEWDGSWDGKVFGVNLGFYFWGEGYSSSSLLPLHPSPRAKTHTHTSEFSVLIL